MKKIISIVIFIGLNFNSFSQLYISPGAQVVQAGAGQITLSESDLINDGSFTSGIGTVRFSGINLNNIKGSGLHSFYNLDIAKEGPVKLTLQTDITVANALIFTSGLLELNNKNIDLLATGFLQNENENSRVVGAAGGFILRIQSMNAPNLLNAGNLGAIITSSANLGEVIIKRSHKAPSGIGITGSILRYYDITPSNNSNLNATLRFNYFDAELNGLTETAVDIFKSTNSGMNWTLQNVSLRDVAANYFEKNSIADFSFWTLATSGGALPVKGLQFSAKRLTNATVHLNWETLQEINNKRFHIERKRANEISFTTVGFQNSKAPAGNSSLPLSYVLDDSNNFNGDTYYRLRQEDIDGKNTYSIVRIVKGNINEQLAMQVWPVPSTGPINILVSGLSRPDMLMLYDVAGKLVLRQDVQNGITMQLKGLIPGTYFIRLAENKELKQKIVIQ